MTIDSKRMVSMTDANQNFSRVAKLADQHGTVVIIKNNKPKYILIDIDKCNLTDTDGNVNSIARQYIDKAKWLV